MNYLDMVQGKLDNYKSTPLNNQNLKEKTEQLRSLKLLCLTFKSLPPSKEQPIQAEFEFAREIIELEMELSCASNNEKAFELSYLQIKPYYFDYPKKINLKQSEKYLYYVGLYLLFLLSNNRTTDFSTEIELLDINDRNNAYIKVSLDIEQCIMEGNYSQLATLRNSKDNYYNYYLGKFDDTTRFQIARSMEKSYESLQVKDAMNLLMFQNQESLGEFIKQQNENKRDDREILWKVVGDKIQFIPINQNTANIPAYRIFNDSLLLGIETEKIV